VTGRRERDTEARLEGVTDDQLAFIRRMVFQSLYSRAGNLQTLNEHPDPKGSVREVAALGRLAESLEGGSVRIPDRAVADAALGIAEDVDAIHETEGVYEQYEQALSEHEAMHALVRLLRGAGDGRGGRGTSSVGEEKA
jgi:hypothetical protein